MLKSSSIITLKEDIMNFVTASQSVFNLEDLLEYLYIDSIDEMIYVTNILDDLLCEGKLAMIDGFGYYKP